MNLQVVISLLATAISFLDAHIAEAQPKGADVAQYIEARHAIGAVIALLRGDSDADVRIEMVAQRRKDKVK